jgi:hypothetical protein
LKKIALLAALILALAVPTTVSAHNSSQLDYSYNDLCLNGQVGVDYTRGFDIVRSSTAVGSRIMGSRGNIVARALWPCQHGNGSLTSKSLVLAANIQTSLAGDWAYNLAQAGIGKVHNQDGIFQCTGSDQMVNDQTHFVYTPNPADSPGVFCRASFVDFNNNGTPDDPVAGREYSFSIVEYNSGSSDYWRICITDVPTGAVDCKNTKRTSLDGGASGGDAAWWGFEVGNSANAIGVPSTYADVVMSQMRYQKWSDKLWYYTENSTVYSPWGANPSYYKYGQSQTGTGESWWAYTSAH